MLRNNEEKLRHVYLRMIYRCIAMLEVMKIEVADMLVKEALNKSGTVIL